MWFEVQLCAVERLSRIEKPQSLQWSKWGQCCRMNTWLIDFPLYSLSFCARLIDWLIDWLIDGLIDWLMDWLFDCLIDWLMDWFFHSFILACFIAELRSRKFKMGNAETSLRRHSESHQVSSSPNHPHHPAVERSLSESQSAAATTPQSIEASPKRHPAAAHRSNSVPAQRYRLDSSGSHYSYSAYSSSLEGGYADHGDGLQPRTFGGE